MAPLIAEVRAVLDERSADQVAQQLADQFGDAGHGASTGFSQAFSRGLGSVRGLGQTASAEFHRGFSGGVDDALRNVSQQFGAMGGVAQSALGSISVGAAAAATGIGLIAAAAIEAGQALYGVGERFDAAFDTIAARTNAAGGDLDALGESLRRVASQSPSSLEDVTDALGRVSQSLHLTGPELELLTDQITDLNRTTGEQLNIRDLGRAVAGFGEDASKASADLDALYTASAATGVPINELLSNMVSLGPAARSAHLSFGEVANLLVTFEQGGIDAGRASAALTHAVNTFAEANIPLQSGLADTITQIRGFITAGDEAAALSLAKDVFGARGAQQFVDLIRNGKLTTEALTREVGNTAGAIEAVDDRTRDWSENWSIIQNKVSDVAENIGGPLFNAINDVLGSFADLLTSAERLDQWRAANGIQPGGVPQSPTPVGSAADVMLGQGPGVSPLPAPGSPSATLPWPLSQLDMSPPAPPPPPQDIAGALADAAAKSKAGTRESLPAAPVVPRAALPGLAPGLTPTSSLLSAQQAVANAETEVAEKRARVLQLDATALATEQQRLDARNDLRKAEEDKAQADLRFAEAQHSALKSQTKAVNDLSGQLTEFGAKLDQDFGISKGLPGIAENLFKFLANLAAAPIEGMLGVVGKANPNEGSGLVGMLAAGGAFGQQYTPAAIAAANSQGLTGGADQASTALNGLASAAYSATGALGGGGSTAAYPASAGRVPYGLPHGSNSGGYGGGGVQFPDWVNQLADQFGIKPSTYPGHQESSRGEAGFAPNPQGLNRAIDWSGPVANMERFADYLATIPQDLEQVIWQNPQTGHRVGIAGGQDVSGTGYYAGDYGGHGNHVHTRQSMSIPLPGAAGGGWWPDLAGASTGGGTGTGAGPFGYLPQAAPFGAGQYGTGMPTPGGAPAGGGWPWLGTPPISSGQGTGPAPGPGMGTGMQPPAAGGPGFQFGGGAIGMAEGAAAMAADMFAPGSGAAVQMASQLINRAIQFGGQAAGIGVSGLMDFFSVGDNPKGAIGNSWLGKLAGGIAGARPALPNMAGQKPPADQLSGPKQPGPVGNSAVNNHVTINNHAATEEGNGRDAVRQLEAMAARPGLHG